jgi:Na+-transporting NADH:ubiquinone oxidoreductase subunit A
MRAILLGDAEACRRLGCLGLLEEDVAHLGGLCSSGTDYAHAYRAILEQLRKDAVA